MVDPNRTINRRRVGALVTIVLLGIGLLAYIVMALASAGWPEATGNSLIVAILTSGIVADRLGVAMGGSGWFAMGTGGEDQ